MHTALLAVVFAVSQVQQVESNQAQAPQAQTAPKGTTLHIPDVVFYTSPIAALLTAIGIGVKRYGVPAFNNMIAWCLFIFGLVLLVVTGGSFAAKIMNPRDTEWVAVRDDYLLVGAVIGFLKMLIATGIHMLPNRKQIENDQAKA